LRQSQTAITSRASLHGVGVHSGQPASLCFAPASADTGIVFLRKDASGAETVLRAVVDEVQASALSTVIGHPSGPQAATVEHIMSALMGLGIDNVLIELDGPEAPILDGSAALIVAALDGAGTQTLDAARRSVRVTRTVRLEHGDSWAEFAPGDRSRFEVEIDFKSPAIGRQAFAIDLEPESYRREIAGARTFGFIKDVERLWAAGLALGSSLENSVVIDDDDRTVNSDRLRFPDEFVRHKLLDAIGDLALAGAPIIGTFRSYRGSHASNVAAVRQLLADPSAHEMVNG